MAWTDPDTGPAVTGVVAPAALWNTFVRDNMKMLVRNGLQGVRVVGTGGGFGERWPMVNLSRATALTTLSLSIGTLHTVPFVSPHGGTLDRIGFDVTTGGSAGSVTRAGLYQATSETDPWPGALIVDGGEIATTTTGRKSATISTPLLAGTLYWAVLLSGTAAPVVAAPANNDSLGVIPGTATDATTFASFRRTQAYGALPSTFPAGPYTTGETIPPAIVVRWSA